MMIEVNLVNRRYGRKGFVGYNRVRKNRKVSCGRRDVREYGVEFYYKIRF